MYILEHAKHVRQRAELRELIDSFSGLSLRTLCFGFLDCRIPGTTTTLSDIPKLRQFPAQYKTLDCRPDMLAAVFSLILSC